MVNQFISLTLEQPIPDNCGQCPFVDTSIDDHAYCPSLGDISDWYGEIEEFRNKRGWTRRHPDCKLQTWEAQRMLRFFVENEHVEITPLMRKLSTPEVRESTRKLMESSAENASLIQAAVEEKFKKSLTPPDEVREAFRELVRNDLNEPVLYEYADTISVWFENEKNSDEAALLMNAMMREFNDRALRILLGSFSDNGTPIHHGLIIERISECLFKEDKRLAQAAAICLIGCCKRRDLVQHAVEANPSNMNLIRGILELDSEEGEVQDADH